MNIITIDINLISMIEKEFGNDKHELMKKKLVEILRDEGIATSELVTRYCNCSDDVARNWLRKFEKEGLITFWVWMRGGKIYKPSATNRNCGISSSHNQEGNYMMSKYLKILREASSNPEKQAAAKVYNWATHMQGETIKNPTENYYMTEDAKRLEFMLANSHEAFIGVIGLQGIGKTRLLEMLAKKFEAKGKKTLFFRWLNDWQKLLKDAEYEFIRHNAKTDVDRLPYHTSIDFLSELNMIFIDLPDYNKKNRDAMSKDLRSIESLWKQVADCKTSEEVTKTNGDLTTTAQSP